MAHEWNSILLLDFYISNYYSGKVDWLVKKASTKLLHPQSVATCQENVSENIV